MYINPQINKIFLTLQAGWTDFGLRDFAFNKKENHLTSFVYAAGIGVGDHNKSYAAISFFGGSDKDPVSRTPSVAGVNISGQLSRKNITINGELAQTNMPDNISIAPTKPFDLKNKSNKAYSVAAFTNWPGIQLNASGYYRYYGINYNGFNSFRIAANNTLWGMEADKSFFKDVLSVAFSIKKNDYKNPYVLQVYDGKNMVKTVNASFRKPGYPYLSAGYIPSFQYISINDTVYENSYQVLNLLITYPYRIGMVGASSTLMVNRYMDGSASAAYFFGNSHNVSFNQLFQFEEYSAFFSTSVLKNNVYTYTVFDINLACQPRNWLELKGGFKVNNMSSDAFVSRLGGYGSLGGTIKKLGRLTASIERAFFPGISHNLYGNTMGSLNFITYFK